MPAHESSDSRCRHAIAELNQHEGWNLAGQQVDYYVEQIRQQVPPRSLTAQLEQVIRYFHAGHQRVAALRDERSPDHAAAWDWAAREIARVAQTRNLGWSRDPAVEIDDLVQTVQAELVRAISSYRFESSLRTWLHGITVQRLIRFHRDSAAAKRTVYREPLEKAETLAVEWHAFEPEVLASALIADINRVLHALGDERYARIFMLRVIDDLTAEQIGRHIQLHPSRIRALLQTARELLQNDLRLRAWIEEDAGVLNDHDHRSI